MVGMHALARPFVRPKGVEYRCPELSQKGGVSAPASLCLAFIAYTCTIGISVIGTIVTIVSSL